MVTFHTPLGDRVLGLTLSGNLTHDDYLQTLHRLRDMHGRCHALRVLIDWNGCQGWGPGAVWDQLRFGLYQNGRGERCGLVGDAAARPWLVKLGGAFGQVEYFDPARRNEAWQWLLRPDDDEIRRRAYRKWEAGGRPPGDGVNFWLQAERELRQPPDSAVFAAGARYHQP